MNFTNLVSAQKFIKSSLNDHTYKRFQDHLFLDLVYFREEKERLGGGGEELLATTQYLIHKDKRENLDLEI